MICQNGWRWSIRYVCILLSDASSVCGATHHKRKKGETQSWNMLCRWTSLNPCYGLRVGVWSLGHWWSKLSTVRINNKTMVFILVSELPDFRAQTCAFHHICYFHEVSYRTLLFLQKGPVDAHFVPWRRWPSPVCLWLSRGALIHCTSALSIVDVLQLLILNKTRFYFWLMIESVWKTHVCTVNVINVFQIHC